jgi:Cu+-exporting ATPase
MPTVAASATSTTTTSISITGMTCASCVQHVTKAVRSLPGVDDVRVNLAGGRAVVTFHPDRTTPDKIADSITQSGYVATPGTARLAGDDPQAAMTTAWRRRAIAGLALWLPVELLHWTVQLFFSARHDLHAGMLWISLLTSTICIVFVGGSFYRSAWKALRHRTTNMDTLVVMGASVAFGYSLVFFLGGQFHAWSPPTLDQLYFMESSAILALISLGHWMESSARRSAGSAIRGLLNMMPATATRILEKQNEHRTSNTEHPTSNKIREPTPPLRGSRFDFDSEEVPLAALHPRDRILLRPGDRIPIDGIIESGTSSIDQSTITGEPLPVTANPGDKVVAGTLNVDGKLIVRATTVGADSALAQIVAMVENAQNSRPPVQKLADQIAAVFVPVVLLIAIATAISWFAIGHAQHWPSAGIWAQVAKATCSVLLIACPCALGLAVPAAIMVGTGSGARQGVLIRDIDALQKAEKIDTVVLDKTGTITLGKPVVTEIHSDAGDENQLLRLAAAAGQFSTHPLAKAIAELAKQRSIQLPQATQFQNQPGLGLTARVEGRDLLVGNQALLDAHTKLPPLEQTPAGTIVQISEKSGDGVHRLGWISLTDQIKPDSIAAIARLRRMGLQTVLLTGDNLADANAVAKLTGIQTVHAHVLPAGKAHVIAELQAGKSHRVAMVGDGINDAPALAAADLGIALGSGSDIARETGDIVLTGNSLTGVATAILLSRRTMRVIRQNLFFAFVYNVVAIPLAACGLLHPVISAGAMALSSVTVVGNALRLRWGGVEK